MPRKRPEAATVMPASTVPPIAASDLPPDWIPLRREIIVRDGVAVRAGAGASIEVKSLTTNEWCRLTLHGGAQAFVTFADRDAVLAQLQGGTP